MIIFVDVDGTVADLQTVVLKHYNNDYQDHLTIADITDWNMGLFAKCGDKIFSYFEIASLYNEVLPIKKALWGVKELKKLGHRVVFATTDTNGTAGRKYVWLLKNGFVDTRKNYVEVSDKSLLNGESLIDDAFHNVSIFNGMGILLNMPWNTKFEWNRRANNWEEIITYFKDRG